MIAKSHQRPSRFSSASCGERCQHCDLTRSLAFDGDEQESTGSGSWTKDKIITGYNGDCREQSANIFLSVKVPSNPPIVGSTQSSVTGYLPGPGPRRDENIRFLFRSGERSKWTPCAIPNAPNPSQAPAGRAGGTVRQHYALVSRRILATTLA